jgi:sulfonate transport system permease protein
MFLINGANEKRTVFLQRSKKNAVIVFKGLTFPLLVIIAWEMAAYFGLINFYFLPSPSKILEVFTNMFSSGALGQHLWASGKRLLSGFLITVISAIPLGILVGKVRYFSHWVNPTLNFLQHIPPIAWIPIFVLWLGINEASKVAVIVYSSFFPVFLNTSQGVSSVDPRLIEVGRAYSLKPLEMLRKIYIPSAAMSIFVGLRLGLSYSWRALVGAELIAASSGIGSLITEGRALSQPDKIFVAILTIGIAGSILDSILKRLEIEIMPWKKMYNNED